MSRVAWGIVKWLLIPAALVALGYFYIGPKLGSKDMPVNLAPIEKPSPADSTAKKFPEPEIDVSVDSLHASSTTTKKPRKRRRRRRPAVESTVQSAPDTPVDSGGSGGAATAGGPN